MNQTISHIESEEAVLGSVLIAPECLPDLNLSAVDFQLHKHRWLWDAITALQSSGESVDALTVSSELNRRGHLDEVGGMAYLARLLNSVPTSMHAEAYARIVKDAATRRRLLEAASAIAKLAADEERPLPETLNDADATLREVLETGAPSAVSHQITAVSEWYDEMSAFMKHGDLPGLTTGYAGIDRKTQGLRRKELTILAGRPSMGKTSLAAQMSIRQARAGLRVGVFSLEESKSTWIEAAALAELGMDKFGNALDIARIADKCTELSALPIVFYEKGYSTVTEIESALRRMAHEFGGLDVIWADHLGYVQHDMKSGSLPFAIGQTTKRLARLAKEFDCAIVALSQLSRESAKTGRPPELIDLRDSGEIEQDARQVWALHTPGYYAAQKPDDKLPQESMLLVLKNSKGRVGRISLTWVASMRRFAETTK